MPHNFDSPLKITNGCLSPTGPLDLAPGEMPVRLDAWVWQGGGACVAVQRVFPDRKTPDAVEQMKWEANPDPKADQMLMPGKATATGLLVSTTAGQTKAFWWTEEIMLD